MTITYVENNLEGVSGDTKPTNVQSNTLFFETNTGKWFEFNGTDWLVIERANTLIMQGGHVINEPAAVTRYHSWKIQQRATSTSEGLMSLGMPYNGRIKLMEWNLPTHVTFNQGNFTNTFVVRKNGVDSTMSIVYDGVQRGYRYSTMTVEFIATDKITVRRVNGSGTGTMSGNGYLIVEFDPY